MKKPSFSFLLASLVFAATHCFAQGVIGTGSQTTPSTSAAGDLQGGVAISLSTSAFKLSDIPSGGTATGAGLIVRGFQASATLANHSGNAIQFVFPTPLDAARHFVFRVFDSKGNLLWDSNAGIITPQVITKGTLPKDSEWKRNVFVPIVNSDGVFPAGKYTLEASISGSPEYSATATFKIGASSDPASTGAGGIRGVALVGPISPVEVAGQPNTSPLARAVIRVKGPLPVASSGGATNYLIQSRTVIAGQDGRFEIAVPAGKYTVTGEPPNPICRFPIGSTQNVTVTAHHFTDITVDYDSGIR